MSSKEALVKSTTFYAKTMIDQNPPDIPGFKLSDTQIEFPYSGKPTFVKFEMQEASVPFRTEATTPHPEITGLHTRHRRRQRRDRQRRSGTHPGQVSVDAGQRKDLAGPV